MDEVLLGFGKEGHGFQISGPVSKHLGVGRCVPGILRCRLRAGALCSGLSFKLATAAQGKGPGRDFIIRVNDNTAVVGKGASKIQDLQVVEDWFKWVSGMREGEFGVL